MTAATGVRKKQKARLKNVFTIAEFSQLSGIPNATVTRVCHPLEQVDAEGPRSARRYYAKDIIAAFIAKERDAHRSEVTDDTKERLEIARAEKLEIDNAEKRGQLVPLVDQVAWESKRSALLARALDSIPGRIKRKYPDMPGKYMSALSDSLAHERNQLVDQIEEEAKAGLAFDTDELEDQPEE